MSNNTIDAAILARMFLAGARNLDAKKEWINELNVFPVPDGDTGTNMTLTILSAASEVSAISEPDMESVCKAISSGSLRGARGNSGVILSQLFRGLTRGIKGYEELDAVIIADAMGKAVETAYKAVMKPKEGTILTVAREASEKAAEICNDVPDLDTFFTNILESAEESLARTPDLLPVLKEAGVVDSGGQGLVEVMRGAIDGYEGKEIDYTAFNPSEARGSSVTRITEETEKEIKFGYCTEFIILLNKPMSEEEEFAFKDYLLSMGDSVVIVADDEIVKVHVHTNHPGEVFEKGLTYGALSRMKVDNMREEHQEKLIKDAEKLAAQQLEEARASAPMKEYGFIAVSAGEGLGNVFKELGADYLIEGGQTMNPSTEDMLNAIRQVRAETIYILPNNKNIVLAAKQAQSLTTDCKVVVVPAVTIPQGITAMISFVPELSAEDNLAAMEDAISTVKTGQVTYAVRDTRLNEKEIHEGDAMGVGDHGILAVGKDRSEVALATVKAMIDEDSEVISVYYGGGIEEEEAEKLGALLEEEYPDQEIELLEGGQPVYYYIISVE